MATTPLGVWISELEFSDGSRVACSPNDVLVIVGPNNSGKSAALRGIRDKLENNSSPNPVVTRLSMVRSGTADDLVAWLGTWTTKNPGNAPQDPSFQSLGVGVRESTSRYDWQREEHMLGNLRRWFCPLLTAEERLQISNPAGNIVLTQGNLSHPIHFLMRDDQLESRLSARFRKAFGVDLVVHRNAGGQIPLHVGARPVPAEGEDRVSLSYVQRLECLPALQSQGDGMRSFAGVLLATSVGRETILLVDEPEAFLHPPQARLLGSALVLDRAPERQLFIATHSTDLLRGVLDSNSSDVRVLRLTRHADTNCVRVLDNSHVRQLWGDPSARVKQFETPSIGV